MNNCRTVNLFDFYGATVFLFEFNPFISKNCNSIFESFADNITAAEIRTANNSERMY